MIPEKLAYCPRCGEGFSTYTKRWLYDAQRCEACGLDRLRPFAKFERPSTRLGDETWRCTGCGTPSPDHARSCECVSNTVYRNLTGSLEIAVKKDAKLSYEPRCYELASTFLEDEPFFDDRHCNELAEAIQIAVDAYIVGKRAEYEPPDQPGFEAGFADNH